MIGINGQLQQEGPCRRMFKCFKANLNDEEDNFQSNDDNFQFLEDRHSDKLANSFGIHVIILLLQLYISTVIILNAVLGLFFVSNQNILRRDDFVTNANKKFDNNGEFQFVIFVITGALILAIFIQRRIFFRTVQ